MTEYIIEHDGIYHEYPVNAQEMSKEGAVKRYTHMPTPDEVFDYALLGLPKELPMTNERMTPHLVAPYLESAMSEIENKYACNLTPVVHFQSEDNIDGMFYNNYMGIKLLRWPATEVIKVTYKFPHTNTASVYKTYTIPSQWIYLQKNKINISASVGSVRPNSNTQNVITTGGLFAVVTGMNPGFWQPGVIEVIYKAGFENDRVPCSVAELVKVWAAKRFLANVAPVLFPTSSVNVSVDGIGQNVGYAIQRSLAQRFEYLDKIEKELSASFKSGFGQTMQISYIGV